MKKKWPVNLGKLDSDLIHLLVLQIEAAEKEEQKAQKGA